MQPHAPSTLPGDETADLAGDALAAAVALVGTPGPAGVPGAAGDPGPAMDGVPSAFILYSATCCSNVWTCLANQY